jgi:hypothetical protein
MPTKFKDTTTRVIEIMENKQIHREDKSKEIKKLKLSDPEALIVVEKLVDNRRVDYAVESGLARRLTEKGISLPQEKFEKVKEYIGSILNSYAILTATKTIAAFGQITDEEVKELVDPVREARMKDIMLYVKAIRMLGRKEFQKDLSEVVHTLRLAPDQVIAKLEKEGFGKATIDAAVEKL